MAETFDKEKEFFATLAKDQRPTVLWIGCSDSRVPVNTITQTKAEDLPVGGKGLLPVRRVIATASENQENIVYWTRLGERLPQSGGEQRDARLKNAMEGFVADGILVR